MSAGNLVALKAAYSPGDGTRYELTLVERHGGGWLVIAWDGQLVGKVYGSTSVEGIEPVRDMLDRAGQPARGPR
jgi:hypothetical protein